MIRLEGVGNGDKGCLILLVLELVCDFMLNLTS